MRCGARLVLAISALGASLAICLLGLPAAAAPIVDPAAQVVLGQPSFAARACNPHHVSAATLCGPHGVVVADDGTLFVADARANRILGYSPPFTSGEHATLVLGQADFTHADCNRGGPPAADTLCTPQALALGASGALYVADFANNRVLRFEPPFSTGEPADLVFGQPDFTHTRCGRAAPSARTLCGPKGVAIGNQGALYVADYTANRVLRYDQPFASGQPAALVLGQPDFASSACNRGGAPSARTICGPKAIAIGPTGALYVSDYVNNRVLRFEPPFSTGQPAALVFGQPDFTHTACNRGAGVAADTLCAPGGMILDGPGNLYVADHNNNRVLLYPPPFSTGMSASGVFGQPDFTSGACNQGGRPDSTTLCGPAVPALSGANLYVSEISNNRVLAFALP